MSRTAAYALLTLVLGWVFQTLFLFAVPAALPTPHWFLLATLAIGLRGRTILAMTSGFLWGLAADAYGMTAFGTQGWLLALVGYASGYAARELNADKLLTQIAVAVITTMAYGAGTVLLRGFFAPTTPAPAIGWFLAAAGVLLNACAAPAVFWAMDEWTALWAQPLVESERA